MNLNRFVGWLFLSYSYPYSSASWISRFLHLQCSLILLALLSIYLVLITVAFIYRIPFHALLLSMTVTSTIRVMT
ncbi:hypothetical protein BDN67DRAFT_83976 [Paxillus ammoniavirescens]|nr:hypothetical protein BDN67DRAFT_83976 [Paxillus ammoniavirescens]